MGDGTIRNNVETWATDTDVSLPTPPTSRLLADYGGFGFSEFGLAHAVTESEIDEMIWPTFAPSSYIPGTAQGRSRSTMSPRERPTTLPPETLQRVTGRPEKAG